ncbi:DNA-binding protein [Paracoccus sp. R86501]|uniref:DNA-binding protein n=1 Tax=Paracoccus sp. R86501 TaxID=3101711 RepID=UPI00366DA183
MPETSVEQPSERPEIILQDPHVAAVVQKRDFIDRVIAASGARKADARPVIEATLAELGRVLSDGHTLAVPPLGRARISCEKDPRGGDVITLRLRRRPAKPS